MNVWGRHPVLGLLWLACWGWAGIFFGFYQFLDVTRTSMPDAVAVPVGLLGWFGMWLVFQFVGAVTLAYLVRNNPEKEDS